VTAPAAPVVLSKAAAAALTVSRTSDLRRKTRGLEVVIVILRAGR
jgi:hypothetical protein